MAAAPAPPVLPVCPSCGGAGHETFPAIKPCAPCAGTGQKRLKVALRVGTPGQCYWNIVWSSIPGGIAPVPMRGGQFPKHHPVLVAGGGSGDAKMDEIRARGYWASCFPEGDGITFQPNDPGRPPEQVALDFEAVFGWSVRR